LLNETELRKRWWPLRSFLLYLLAAGGMAVFTWFASGYGFWEKGPFLFYNWIVFLALLTGSAFLYVSLLIIFREEQVLKITNRLKSILIQR
jgi:hypothetical protein